MTTPAIHIVVGYINNRPVILTGWGIFVLFFIAGWFAR